MKDSSEIIQSYDTEKGKRYAFDFQLRGIRCRRSGFLTSEECYSVMLQIRMDIYKGQYQPDKYFSPLQKDMTLKTFWTNHYIQKIQRSLKARTVKNKQSFMVNHCLPELGDVKIRSINSNKLNSFFNTLSQKGLTQGSQATYWMTLRGVLEHARELGFIQDIPSFNIEMKLTKDKKILTKSELKDLIYNIQNSNHLTQTMKNLIQVMFWTGMRVGEVTTLQKNDIDLVNNKITVSRTAGIQKGQTTSPKSGKIQSIPLHPEARKILVKQMKLIPSDTEWMFPNKSGDYFLQRSVSRKLKRSAIDALGNAEGIKVTPHALRRTLASVLVDEGTPLDAVASLMRHNKQTLVQSYNRANQQVLESKYFAFSVKN